MSEVTDGADGRPGCAAGRLLGGAVRLALVYPLVSIGSHLGQAAQQALVADGGTPYEGAFLGIIAGILIGLSLWRRAVEPDGWRGRVADVTLALMSALWLGALFAMPAGLGAGELVTAWSAGLVGSAGIAVLLRL